MTQAIPHDYTYNRPSKKSRGLMSQGQNIYLPKTKKEGIDVVAALDTSGSISQRELEEFLGEVVGITESFEAVNLTVVQHDAAVHDVTEIRNADRGKITERIKAKGGGGTSHKCVFDHIRENGYNAKVLVAFTDGYTSVPDEPVPGVDVIWVVNNRDVGLDTLKHGVVVRKDRDE